MEALENPVQLSKGINLQELLNGHAELHIDVDFRKKNHDVMTEYEDDLFPDSDDDSESEDIMQKIEKSPSKQMLESPNYMSFKDLATKMIDCLPSGDVKMLIVEEGDGPLVSTEAEVKLHYAAYYEHTTIPFDSTLTMNYGEPIKIQLGIGKIIPGLEIGLTSVKGPKAMFNLLLQPRVAWGERGIPPRIRPEPVLFVVVLYDTNHNDNAADLRYRQLPEKEQKSFKVTKETVKSIHSQAKTLFQSKKYNKAIRCYQKSISILNISETKTAEEGEEIKKLQLNSYINLAVCYYKTNKPKNIINMCNTISYLTDIQKHCKALFYYGRAHDMLGNKEEAAMYYKKALQLEPKNKDIGKALSNLDKYYKMSEEKEKEMWQNAIQVPHEKKKNYDVDDDFLKSAREMCEDLAGREEHTKIDLPTGLMKNEVDCIKDICSQFDLICVEDGEGKRKKVSVIKKVDS
ncbi:inactive peptidyl-prolyl cis-trans isomerase shutdown-like [Aricia agestis]|uniref:inactive peptidyl-prolyl cis-trans isomerase shutdown-like n=1 Tax=Aricia agestis TaxID=91739 RepID=UPI001C2069F9|nr:inactive peptidyl-prolyl cis-trans isomerase shutdown-like [Aricia agestis]